MAKQTNPLSSKNKRPHFFYGYIIVISSFVLMLFIFGINFSFGIFLRPLLIEFGRTVAATSGIYSVMTIMSGLLGIFAGRLSDIFGPKILGIASGLFLGIGFLLMSRVTAFWQIYMIYGSLIAAGVGSIWPILMPTVARWFILRRGLMTGIVGSGIGLGTITIPMLATSIITTFNWRFAYILIGTMAMILIVVASFFLKSDPRAIGQLPYGNDRIQFQHSSPIIRGYSFKEAIRTKNFIILFTVFFCFGFSLHSIIVHIVKHVADIGISVTSGATVLAIIGTSNIVGRIVMASASDKTGTKASLIIGFIIMSIALFWLPIANELWMLYLFAVAFGFAYGNIIALLALAPVEFFGLRSLGVILGTIVFSYTIGGAAGPAVVGYIFDITGRYYQAFWVIAAIALVGCMLAVLLEPPCKQENIKEMN